MHFLWLLTLILGKVFIQCEGLGFSGNMEHIVNQVQSEDSLSFIDVERAGEAQPVLLL